MSESDRQKTRRLFAYVAFLVCTAFGVLAIVALFNDPLMQRLIAGWGPLSTIFGGFLAFVGWYAKLGSDETKHALEVSNGP